jgi:carboxyl-terminal processing protease
MSKNIIPQLILVFSLFHIACYSQIINKSFDSLSGDSSFLPWKVKSVPGYSYALDRVTKHSGTYALRLFSDKNDKDSFIPFSQVAQVSVDRTKKITVTAFIKCLNVQNESTLWCQILDESSKMIGFQNLGVQGVKVGGTSDWTKYTMPMTLSPKAKKLLLGGYLQGTGTAWFDDFEIEELSRSTVPASKAVTSYLQSFLNIVKENSIYTDSIKWPIVEKEVFALSAGLTKIEEARPVLEYILDELRAVGDNHSFIQNKVAAVNYTQVNSNPEKSTCKLLAGNIGYLSVPGFSSTNKEVSQQFATEIQNMIRGLDIDNNISGWIVDLRSNTGGNMYPMRAGLGPLMGEGTLGYFIRRADQKELKSPWFYKKGSSGAGSSRIVTVTKPYRIKDNNAHIAVLIGPKTSSSGEMTTISFIGNNNTKLFGTASGGYTTGNGMFNLSDGANLLLATSITADRNLKKYAKKITPDIAVKQNNSKDDDAIVAASKWLLTVQK